MSAICYNPNGTPNCGDPEISDQMKREADRVKGYVVDTDTGTVIYDARDTPS